jgi:hypothetical protein
MYETCWCMKRIGVLMYGVHVVLCWSEKVMHRGEIGTLDLFIVG